MFAGSHHVYPYDKGHIATGFDCWCNPIAHLICPSDCMPGDMSCWQCQGMGIIPASAYDIQNRSHELIIIHNDVNRDNRDNHGQASTRRRQGQRK